MRNLVIMGAALLMVSACSQGDDGKDADKDGDGKTTMEEVRKELESGGKMAMKPGEWEVKISFSEIEGDGIPEQAKAMVMAQMGKGMTTKSCITEAQAEQPGADLFGGGEEQNCTFNKFDRSGNSMNIDMTCKPAGGMTINSKMNGEFAAESYSMTMEQEMTGAPMGALTMKGKIEGRRLGDCPA